jgi:tetratricopeptide (TPR) repeat protein
MELAPADLTRIRELYTQGRYRQAYDASVGFGPVRAWTGTAARLIGGRLAIQLGAPTLGRRLHLLAYRSTPHHPEAIYYHARYRVERFGPLAAWRFMRANPDWSDAPPELHSDWLALQGFVAARLRDFDRAERWLNRAEAIAPNRPWPCVERASACEFADRLDDALASARRALELHPWFRPGVQAAAHALLRLGRDREALDVLTEAAGHLESGLVLAQLAGLQNDLGHHTDAARSLDRYVELSPLMEDEVRKWLAARRADTAYLLGDSPAATHAREVGEEFYTKFADRLEAASRGSSEVRGQKSEVGEEQEPPSDLTSELCPLNSGNTSRSPRITLPVDLSFDRTPPTVYDLLARFWKHPLSNPGPDTTPPPDALPDAAERRRVELASWRTTEFTLTPDAAFDLVGRGVPFLVTLVEAGFAQPRLVIGADRLKHTVSLADGLDRKPIEAPLDTLTDRFAFAGPRCLALVPAAEATRLDGFAPPGAEAHDLLFAVQKPLLVHDRPAAAATLDRLKERFPGHRLAKLGELVLARYDGHPLRTLRALDALLADFPREATWVLSKAAIFRDLHRLPERLALLEEEGSALDAEPMLMQSLAQMLLPLPQRQADAARLLRRSVRTRPGAAAGYYLLATQWWEHRRFEDAAEVYRFACTLDEREDQFADAYFRAARATEQVPEVVRLFQQRAGRAAVPTPSATRALYQALMDRDEPEQAFAALDQAINKLANGRREPPDPDRASERREPLVGSENKKQGAHASRSAEDAALGELLLFRAECHAGFGRFEEADADLAAARPLAPPAVWHRAAAKVARVKPDLAASVLHFLEVVKLDPLAADAHRSLTALLADTDGRAAARTHLGQVVQKFPHAYPLLKLRVEFLSGDPEADADRAIQDMLDECPDDAWALRQRALVLADRKRTDEALTAVRRAGELEPGHPWYYGVLAQVQRRADRSDEALAACRDALRANVDQEPLVTELVQLSRGRQEKHDALKFLADELERQPHTGEGLIAFVTQSRQAATEPDDHQELLEYLERTCDDRPDLWHAWSVLVQQLAGMNRLEEANELAREATGRFPLLSKLWLDRAQVCQAMGNAEGRLDALRQAVAVSPGWSLAARELAEALEEAGEPDEAVAILERTAARSPLDPFAHGFLAEQLWEAGRSRDALERAKRAVRHEPGYDWAWHAIQVWAERLEVPDEPAELCRELCRDRAGDPRVWLRLARLLHHPRHNDEVLAALDRAIALEPKNVEAHDLKAERLAEIGKFDEALAAAQPPQLAGELPFVLQGRVAWVEAKRGNYAAAIPPMQALVAVDPSYVWGWHQLAEWYNETGRPQGYLEAASELVRLQPGHPVALMMRGEAKLQTGDRDGGKADLRDALKVSPGYSPAAAVLFEAHLADEEFREARQVLAVLQEHAAGPEVALRQVQLACRTGEADAAARAFAEICEGPGQSPHPIQSALSEMENADWEDRAQRVLREAWQSGGPFQPWVPLFWIDSDEGREADPGERLRAAEAAIKAYPKFTPGHDCKAEQLALAGRYDEALAACRPAELGDPPPVELRGRAAWVEARRGERAKAIALMKQVVADDPEFVLGWRQLAAWYDAAGRYRECLEAAEQFVKLEPANPVAFVYRGEAKRNVGDRRGALGDFQKAVELDPSFEAAGISLISEQLATGDVAGAARTLSTVQEHADGPLVRLRAVQVACRQGEFDAALARLRGLATDPEVSRGLLREAMTAFDAEGWGPRLTAELKDLAFADEANPDVVGLWAERAVEAGSIDAVADRIPELLARSPEAGREGVLAYARALVLAGKPIQGAVQKYSEVLRSDDDSWARAGDILVGAGNHALAAAWLADWREREDLEAWMLRPLTAALRSLDQDDKAVEVCRAAVRLGGPDDQVAEFRAWLALDLALSGQAEEAAGQLARVDAVTIPDGTRLVVSLAEAVVMVSRAGPGGKAAAFAEAKEHLRSAAGSVAARDVPAGSGRAYRKVVSRIAADTGTLGAKLWALWQRLAPWVK